MSSRLDLANVLALALTLGLAMTGGALGGESAQRGPVQTARPSSEPAVERLPDGSPALRDASGTLVPLRRYQRIASASLIADRVLLDLAEPARVVAHTRYAQALPIGHRFADRPTLDAHDDPERVLALKPDLLIASDLVAPSFAARLREHGVQVFVLPPAQGLATLLPDIRVIGALLGEPARAARYADALAGRMRKVAANLAPNAARPRALYLSSYGGRLFAAARQTSYHDAITHAGLRDAAAERDLTGWPELTGEQVLTLDPDVLITRTGMSAVLCRHPGLAELRSCRDAGRTIELDGALLDDPGPGLLEATEAIHDAFWTR